MKKRSNYSTVRLVLSHEHKEAESQALKDLAHGQLLTVSSYLRQLIRQDYQRREDANQELFAEFQIGGDYSTDNPKYQRNYGKWLETRRHSKGRKARKRERKNNDDNDKSM